MPHRRLVNLQRDCRFSIVFDSEAFPGLVKFHQTPALLAMAQTSRFDPVVSWETGNRLLRPSCAHQIAVPLRRQSVFTSRRRMARSVAQL